MIIFSKLHNNTWIFDPLTGNGFNDKKELELFLVNEPQGGYKVEVLF